MGGLVDVRPLSVEIDAAIMQPMQPRRELFSLFVFSGPCS